MNPALTRALALIGKPQDSRPHTAYSAALATLPEGANLKTWMRRVYAAHAKQQASQHDNESRN